MKPSAIILMAALAVTIASPAEAKLINFEVTGSRQASFQINTDNPPDTSSTSVFGDQIQYLDVSGVYGGVAETATIGFGTSIFAQLNILATGLGFTQFAGPDLFTGSVTNPQFNFGTFALSSLVSGPSTITISAASPVPEPSTWAMLVLGFAALGFVGYRKTYGPGSRAA